MPNAKAGHPCSCWGNILSHGQPTETHHFSPPTFAHRLPPRTLYIRSSAPFFADHCAHTRARAQAGERHTFGQQIALETKFLVQVPGTRNLGQRNVTQPAQGRALASAPKSLPPPTRLIPPPLFYSSTQGIPVVSPTHPTIHTQPMFTTCRPLRLEMPHYRYR